MTASVQALKLIPRATESVSQMRFGHLGTGSYSFGFLKKRRQGVIIAATATVKARKAEEDKPRILAAVEASGKRIDEILELLK